jgi:hypothetical protein
MLVVETAERIPGGATAPCGTSTRSAYRHGPTGHHLDGHRRSPAEAPRTPPPVAESGPQPGPGKTDSLIQPSSSNFSKRFFSAVKHLPGRPKTDQLDAVWLCKVSVHLQAARFGIPPLPEPGWTASPSTVCGTVSSPPGAADRRSASYSNARSKLSYYGAMTCQPREPDIRHVWVRGHSDYAPVLPGLVINWQHTPARLLSQERLRRRGTSGAQTHQPGSARRPPVTLRDHLSRVR